MTTKKPSNFLGSCFSVSTYLARSRDKQTSTLWFSERYILLASTHSHSVLPDLVSNFSHWVSYFTINNLVLRIHSWYRNHLNKRKQNERMYFGDMDTNSGSLQEFPCLVTQKNWSDHQIQGTASRSGKCYGPLDSGWGKSLVPRHPRHVFSLSLKEQLVGELDLRWLKPSKTCVTSNIRCNISSQLENSSQILSTIEWPYSFAKGLKDRHLNLLAF